MVIFNGVCAIANGMNSFQCFGRVSRPARTVCRAASVQAGAIRDALTIPDAAILRDTENQPFVYVQSGSNQFARRLVKVADSQGGRTQVTEGLKEGERVVGDGSLFAATSAFLLGASSSGLAPVADDLVRDSEN